MPSNVGQELLSSPDPLNDSPTFYSPVRSNAIGIRKSLPSQGNSPRKQTFQLDVGDHLSPQRIRVTVEADHSDDKPRPLNYGSQNVPSPTTRGMPNFRQNVRTTTTTIPLKGLSDSEGDSFDTETQTPKRGRHQSRRSVGTPVAAKSRTRIVTPGAKPSPRRRRTLGDLVDGDDSDDWDFAIGAGVEVGRGKGRSRSGSTKSSARNKATPLENQTGLPNKTASSAIRKARGRRKTLTPEEILIHEDESEPLTCAQLDGSKQHENMTGVLSQRDMNCIPTNSAFSTIRTNTTVWNDEPDVLLAKFSPAQKYPAKVGWSSPRSVPVTSRGISTPSLTKFSRKSSFGEDKIGEHVAVEESANEVVNDAEANDDGELIRDDDTILESEGFSMISVDSVPSLRNHLSSPLAPPQNSNEKSPTARSQNISRLQNDEAACAEDSFSSIAPDVLEAATPRRKSRNPRIDALRPALKTRDEDSFSSIPADILEAATPGRPWTKDEHLSIMKQKHEPNDDSFSTIPSTIMREATPAKHLQFNTAPAGSESAPNSTAKSQDPSFPYPTEVGTQRNTTSRLLTPEETPSPPESGHEKPKETIERSGDVSVQNFGKIEPAEASSMLGANLRSSPPSVAPRRFTYTAHLRQRRSLQPNVNTPSIVFSSPSLPPLLQQLPPNKRQSGSKGDKNAAPQPSLSPIVRAGRVLQEIAIPSSNRGKTQSLGSPFKSPAAQRKSGNSHADGTCYESTNEKSEGPEKESEKIKSDIFGAMSDDIRQELRKSFLMGEELAFSQSKSSKKPSKVAAAQQEDPFNSGIRQLLSPSPEKDEEYILEVPRPNRVAYAMIDSSRQDGTAAVQSDSAMSWQAENGASANTSLLEAKLSTSLDTVLTQSKDGQATEAGCLNQRRELEWAHQRTAVSSLIESANTSQVVVISSDSNEESAGLSMEIDGFEEDIWQAEARSSSSLLEEAAHKDQARKQHMEKPRRSKIPSPWRKSSRRQDDSDEDSHITSSFPAEKSKAAQPQLTHYPEFCHNRAEETKKEEFQSVREEEDQAEFSMNWHIPQKLNFNPRPRNDGKLDLSALLASSPLKMPSLGAQNLSSVVPHRVDASTAEALFNSEDSQDEVSAESSGASYEEYDTTVDLSQSDEPVTYPYIPTISPSPQKSCLRTPNTAPSPTKSVLFVSPTPPPQLPPLSSTMWSKAHWKLIRAIYLDAKARRLAAFGSDWDSSASSSGSVGDGREAKENAGAEQEKKQTSRYLGKTIFARGEELLLEQWHLDMIEEFRAEVPGWDEEVIAKRLFAIIVGEKLRRLGLME